MNAALRYTLCIAIGLFAAIARQVYNFFPGIPITDIVFFGATGALVAYVWPDRYWRWIAVVLVLPLVLVGRKLARLGMDNLEQGIGTGWAMSVLLIPLAAFVGGFLGAKVSTRRAVSRRTA